MSVSDIQAAANEQAAHYQKLIEKAPVHVVERVDSVTRNLDDLLSLLRKHKVAEFEQDGIKLKFEHSTFLISDALPTATARTEPAGPELGAVEPSKHDLEDVLYGAK